MSKYHIPLLPNELYHVFNRAIGNDRLFKTEENYRYFLFKMANYILPVADILTYSLLPNHFHLLIRVKSDEIIITYFELKKKKRFNALTDSLSDFIMEQFSNWLNGYTKAFNKMYSRKGALFIDYLKRSCVKEDCDFTSFIFYIHKNAVHHNLSAKIGEWKHDGYNSIVSTKPSLLLRDEVIKWFGSVELFIKFHAQPVQIKLIDFEPNL